MQKYAANLTIFFNIFHSIKNSEELISVSRLTNFVGNSIITKRKRCATIILMKRLILVDDHKMLRKGIISYITENSDLQIFAEAESTKEIPGIIKEAGKSGGSITVAVVDMQLKGEKDGFNEGYNVVKMLSQGNIPSVIFSSHDRTSKEVRF